MLISPSQRRGLASLELVLSLPFLLAVAVIIASLAKVGLAKSSASIEARANAWRQRAAVSGSKPSLTGADFASATSGTVSGQGSSSVRMAPVLAPAGITAESRHQVLAGTWDHRILRPGAEQLRADPLMAAFILGGLSPDEIAQKLSMLDGSNYPVVQSLQELMSILGDLIRDIQEFHRVLQEVLPLLEMLVDGKLGLKPEDLTKILNDLTKDPTGAIADILQSSGLGGVVSLLGGGGGGGSGPSPITKILKLWELMRNNASKGAQLVGRLPSVLQGITSLASGGLGGQRPPKQLNIDAEARRQLEGQIAREIQRQLGLPLSVDELKNAITKLKTITTQLQSLQGDLERVKNFAGQVQDQIARYARF
ncbi:MAG: hypothetical protein JNM56_09465 [Planctomycetia bacterium]|nr:hypothetical protein [Planctomycetia bacterium]